jgi:hypothetical protein
MGASGRFVVGRPLASDASNLLDEVEKMYGCAVIFMPWRRATSFDGGKCTVDKDGTPLIRMAPLKSRSISTLRGGKTPLCTSSSTWYCEKRGIHLLSSRTAPGLVST